MAHRVLRRIVCVTVMLTASAAFGQDVGVRAPSPEELPASLETTLALADFEQLALGRNPTLVQAIAQRRISQGKALQAGLYPNPTVGYAAEQMGADGTAGEFHGMFIEQQLIPAGKLDLSRAKFAQEARQAELQIEAQQHRVLYGVRAAFYDALVRQRRLQLRLELMQVADEIAKTVEELVNVGQANRADLLQAQIQSQRARANVQTAERHLQGAWEQLAAVAGVPEMAPVKLEGSLNLNDTDMIDRDATLEHLLTCSPQLRFAQAEVVRDRIGLRRERVEPIPNVTLRAETGYNFEAADTVAGVEVGLRLPMFDKNQGTIIQAQAELTRAQAEVVRIELMLRQRFAEVFADYQAALVLANTFRNEALPRAEEAFQLYLDSFQQRRAAWPQVIDAQREYYELYDEYLDNVLQARRAEAQISAMLLEDGLTQPPAPTPAGHRDATPRPR